MRAHLSGRWVPYNSESPATGTAVDGLGALSGYRPLALRFSCRVDAVSFQIFGDGTPHGFRLRNADSRFQVLQALEEFVIEIEVCSASRRHYANIHKQAQQVKRWNRH